eukprot:CAMPEP_0183350844 /NCGR_PEP_ID=MMETSP0164_2-20130417/21337_1 /TAXON_ID=221442 /ORGANISM="Coccolithus pelagicus ssp braarudi, Strain PLY182g" /LENGTH=77 /DNA_ID=CAMNT_0025522849 /DNA_START=117 /DNA_END=350 /DNA_ORIENTATION=-
MEAQVAMQHQHQQALISARNRLRCAEEEAVPLIASCMPWLTPQEALKRFEACIPAEAKLKADKAKGAVQQAREKFLS